MAAAAAEIQKYYPNEQPPRLPLNTPDSKGAFGPIRLLGPLGCERDWPDIHCTSPSRFISATASSKTNLLNKTWPG